MTLIDDSDMTYDIDLDTNFTAMIPSQLSHGEYHALFSGNAKANTEMIKFRGELTVEELEFHVSFTIPNDYGIPVSGEEEDLESEDELSVEAHEMDEHEFGEEYDANGEFEVTIGPVSAPIPKEKTWIKIKGLINQSGGQPAFGLLKVHAKLGEWTRASAFWTTTIPALSVQHFEDDDNSHGNFRFSFYAARLVNASAVEINNPDSNFYIKGYWNVYNVSWIHREEDFTYTVESLNGDRPGELTVTESMTLFTLSIQDLEPLSGRVIYFLYRSFTIPRCDVNEDYVVNIWDLVHVAKRYGAKPGKPDFDLDFDDYFDLDFDDDFEIGLGELTTVAANLGTEY